MIRSETTEPRPRKWFSYSLTITEWVVVALTLGVLFAMFYLPSHSSLPRRGRPPCKNNLKQIGLALHNYHDTYKSFPPAFVVGPDGKPWHSWRVLILPFLEEEPLWKKYRLDEPWNGPNNSKLLKERPVAFACRSFDSGPWVAKTDTTYVAVVGAETVWPGASSIPVADVADGLSNTVFVVEVRDAGIAWLAPDDLSLEEAILPPRGVKGRRVSSIHFTEGDPEHGGVNVLFGDGTVRFVNSEIAPETWKALLTRAGGEAIPEF